LDERLLIENCHLLNGSDEDGRCSVLVERGIISKISRRGTPVVPDGTRRFDAKGGTLLPGLIDTHCHLVGLGAMKRILDLTGTTNLTALRLRLFAKVKKAPAGEWIIGRGWDQEVLAERRNPNRWEIDDLTPKNPTFLTRVCGHVALVNTRAMDELGIRDDVTDSRGLIYERNADGRLTGIIKERAVEEGLRKVERGSREMISRDILSAEFEATKNGLTTLHCILSSGYEDELEALLRLREEGKLAMRYRVYLPVEAIEGLAAGAFRVPADPMFKILGVKVFADGSLGARTAALMSPYSDDAKNSGILRYQNEELRDILQRAQSHGLQVLIHAIGDAAVSQAVNAIESVTRGKNYLRHRIEHCSLVTRETMKRLKKAGVGVTVQPHFIVSDSWARERLGKERLSALYPLKSLLREGVIASGGSDSPVEPISPILGMWASMVRTDYSLEERLTIQEAVRIYTKNAAFNGFDEEVLGELKEGLIADLTILDSDVREMHPAMLRKVGIVATIVRGRVVYSYEGIS